MKFKDFEKFQNIILNFINFFKKFQNFNFNKIPLKFKIFTFLKLKKIIKFYNEFENL